MHIIRSSKLIYAFLKSKLICAVKLLILTFHQSLISPIFSCKCSAKRSGGTESETGSDWQMWGPAVRKEMCGACPQDRKAKWQCSV